MNGKKSLLEGEEMMVNLTINNIPVSVPEGTTVLDAAKSVNVKIPTLCHYEFPEQPKINKVASCRVCVVEVEGRRNLAPACATLVNEGMKVKTNTIKAIKARRTMVELLLSDHPNSCLTCPKNTMCELQDLAADLGVRDEKYKGSMSTYTKDESSLSFVKDLDKCIMCRRCERMCNDVQTCGVLSGTNRGFEAVVNTAFELPQMETACTFCGQCISVCPTGALTEVSNVRKVFKAIANPDLHVVVQAAPAVRVALGEIFGLEPGTIVTGQMVSALRMLGFDKVFDTDFAADLTVMEETYEFLNRLQNGGRLPILTSCCPGWVKFFEHNFQDLLDVPSTCKSPHEMLGAVTKSYYAEKMGIPAEKIYVVSVMPCVAKKYEAARAELANENKVLDVDTVITTRELGAMIKEAGLDFNSLECEDFDNPLGESTGASVIFGVTGGVIEAVLRTAAEIVTGKELTNVEFSGVRGMQGIKETTVNLDGKELKIGVAHGLGNARKLLESIRAGECHYDAIEIMACPGGCIDGGGQPYIRGNMDIVAKRAEAIYTEDRGKEVRQAHKNPYIKKLYEEYLGEPNGHKAHDLLHTHYVVRQKM